MSSWQFISEHFELENGVNMTPKRRSFLSALFFTCLRRPSNSLLSLPKSWTNEKTKVIKYIVTNVERLRQYAEYANFRQTDPHCTCKSGTKDKAKERFTWSTTHTTILRILWYFIQWPTQPSPLAPRRKERPREDRGARLYMQTKLPAYLRLLSNNTCPIRVDLGWVMCMEAISSFCSQAVQWQAIQIVV